jgi:hypothetical protein
MMRPCGENVCGSPGRWSSIRQEVTVPDGWDRQLAEFAESLVVLPHLVEAVERDRLHRAPGAGEWSAHVIVCHLVLDEMNAATSLRLILTQDCPMIAEIEDDRCAERFAPLYPDTATALRLWRALREDNVRLCASVSPADLERVGRVPWRAEHVSFRDYVASRGRHDRVHIDQIRSALSR